MSQHTPGPWTIRNRSIVQVWSEQGGIAQVYSQDQQAANASLIAAAPALLEALEAMVNAPRPSHMTTVGQRLALEKARAAIAQAKGEDHA